MIVPPPPVTLKVICTAESGLPSLSVNCTFGAMGRVLPNDAVWLSPATLTSMKVTGLKAVAVKVTGPSAAPVRIDGNESAVTVKVSVPGVGPMVQLPTAANPPASVVWTAPVTEPPPEATAKVTC